jgi:hypothetical protein
VPLSGTENTAIDTAAAGMAAGGAATFGIGTVFAALLEGVKKLAQATEQYTLHFGSVDRARTVLAITRLVPTAFLLGQVAHVLPPNDAALHYNALRAAAGEWPIPPGVDALNIDLYKVCGDSALGPLVCNTDPRDPMSTADFWGGVLGISRDGTVVTLDQSADYVRAHPLASPALTPDTARATLAYLRAGAKNGTLAQFMGGDAAGGIAVASYVGGGVLPRAVAEARRIAGESGPDPTLAAAVGGSVTTYAPGALPDGVAVRGSGNTVYVARDGILHGVPTPAALRALGLDARVEVIPDAAISALPVGEPVHRAGARWAVPEDLTWWWIGGLVVAGAFVGGAAWIARRRVARANALSAAPGEAAYQRVLREGLVDGELGAAGRADPAYRRAFRRARLYGILPTDLAASGRYFGEEVLPVRVDVHPDARLRLASGQPQYAAAKAAGARAILADVRLVDDFGDVVDAFRGPVGLV